VAKTKAEMDREYYLRNKERIKARANAYYYANREKALAQQQEYYQQNREGRIATNRAWADANRDKMNAYHSQYVKRNRDKWTSQTAKYRATRKQATPAWADEFLISEAYHLAQLRKEICGGEWHVDHIVPLTSDVVCGLHTHDNLRVIRGKENRVKSNRFWEGKP
jgi:hypothetical protein